MYDAGMLENLFVKSISLIVEAKGNDAFRRGNAVNAALFDSMMIGVASRLQKREMQPDECRKIYDRIMIDPSFVQNSTYSTADEKNLKERIKIAIEQFSNGL